MKPNPYTSKRFLGRAALCSVCYFFLPVTAGIELIADYNNPQSPKNYWGIFKEGVQEITQWVKAGLLSEEEEDDLYSL